MYKRKYKETGHYTLALAELLLTKWNNIVPPPPRIHSQPKQSLHSSTPWQPQKLKYNRTSRNPETEH